MGHESTANPVDAYNAVFSGSVCPEPGAGRQSLAVLTVRGLPCVADPSILLSAQTAIHFGYEREGTGSSGDSAPARRH